MAHISILGFIGYTESSIASIKDTPTHISVVELTSIAGQEQDTSNSSTRSQLANQTQNKPVLPQEKNKPIAKKITKTNLEPNPVKETINTTQTEKPSTAIPSQRQTQKTPSTLPTHGSPTDKSATHSDNGSGQKSQMIGIENGSQGNSQTFLGDSGTGTSTAASISQGQINSIARQYPEDARNNDIEGVVHLKVTIGTNGRAKNISIINSPHRLLANAARVGAKNASYKPAFTAGKPVEAELEFKILYKLKNN